MTSDTKSIKNEQKMRVDYTSCLNSTKLSKKCYLSPIPTTLLLSVITCMKFKLLKNYIKPIYKTQDMIDCIES